MLPFYSIMSRTRTKYFEQVLAIRNQCIIEDVKITNPEYINQLEELVNHPKEKISYYYHGTPCIADAKNILEKGLFMQYADIARTAQKELTLSGILNYSYGHENVGKHVIVVIATPNKGSNIVVKSNKDKDVKISGTGQGKEGINEFTPNYVIPTQYILGYIDKDDKIFVPNPRFVDFSKGKRGLKDSLGEPQLTTTLVNKTSSIVKQDVRQAELDDHFITDDEDKRR